MRKKTIKNMKTIKVKFPKKTAKEIVDECGNKVDNDKLIYSTWMLEEDFYTKETCREGERVIELDIQHKGKSWNECSEMAKNENKELLNFAEVVYLLRECSEYRELFNLYWIWTYSRASGGDFVCVGDFESDGVDVIRGSPDSRLGLLGVSLSRSENMKSDYCECKICEHCGKIKRIK